ncbi:MAG: type II toxin-antitoxin system VapC family toxin [Algoriphagus sp.]|jgi:predicted nucleic acid-binding protein|nr:type II toxin-antitoxin system VapC family toxin [Algoriphagus sp.]MCE2779258.1 type II toxin-antitoxin system VapC family toxin [Algoriphagus sp.]
MGRYLIDSNIISDFFANNLEKAFLNFLDSNLENSPIFSVITQIELLSWKTSPEIEKSLVQFFETAQVIGLRKDIADTCVGIRRAYSMKIPDAIIAATALREDLILVTKNSKDFTRIKGLRIYNFS